MKTQKTEKKAPAVERERQMPSLFSLSFRSEKKKTFALYFLSRCSTTRYVIMSLSLAALTIANNGSEPCSFILFRGRRSKALSTFVASTPPLPPFFFFCRRRRRRLHAFSFFLFHLLTFAPPLLLKSPSTKTTGHLAGYQPWTLHVQSQNAQAGTEDVVLRRRFISTSYFFVVDGGDGGGQPTRTRKHSLPLFLSLSKKKLNDRTSAATSTTSPASATAPRARSPTPATRRSARTAPRAGSTSS